MPAPADFLRLNDAAAVIGLAPVTLRHHAREGRIRCTKAGAHQSTPLLFDPAEVERYRQEWKGLRKPCAVCGTPFRPSRATELLCSPACRKKRLYAMARDKYGFRAVCGWCGEEMPRAGEQADGSVGGRKWCGKCRRSVANQQEADRGLRIGLIREARVVRVCACGKSTRMRRGQYFCSPDCRERTVTDTVTAFAGAMQKMYAKEQRVYG